MNTRILAPVALCAAMLATPVLAAGSSLTGTRYDWKAASPMKTAAQQRCDVYRHQFDFAIKWHKQSPKSKDAISLRNQGVDLCSNAGTTAEGMDKMRQALNDLGIQPQG